MDLIVSRECQWQPKNVSGAYIILNPVSKYLNAQIFGIYRKCKIANSHFTDRAYIRSKGTAVDVLFARKASSGVPDIELPISGNCQ